jgi:hypothetical protein
MALLKSRRPATIPAFNPWNLSTMCELHRRFGCPECHRRARCAAGCGRAATGDRYGAPCCGSDRCIAKVTANVAAKRAEIPIGAVPVTLWGEAACAFADELGLPVSTYALKGSREMSTAEARAYLAKGREQGSNWSTGIWLVTAYNVDAVLG